MGKAILNGLWDGLKAVWDGISDWVSDKVSWLADKLTFWDNGTKKMSSAASSATYSAYSAGNTSSSGSSTQTINVSLELDGQRLARQTYSYNQAEAARRGTNFVTG